MMKNFRIAMAALAVFLFAAGAAQAQSGKMTKATVHVYGNCGMCEKTIEQSGSQKGVAEVDWDKKSKKAVIQYDASKTSVDEILKRIADSGYDNEKYTAPAEVYAELPKCCKYDRKPQ